MHTTFQFFTLRLNVGENNAGKKTIKVMFDYKLQLYSSGFKFYSGPQRVFTLVDFNGFMLKPKLFDNTDDYLACIHAVF